MKQQQHLFTNKMLRALLVPIIMEQLLNALMGTVDTMMVSNVGSAAISAVSLVDSINVLIIQAFSALAAGGTIICTQYLGQKNHEMANKSARQALFIITAISVFIVVLGLAFRAPLLSFIFGKVDANAKVEDIALGIVHMVLQTIGQGAVFASLNGDIKNIVLIGNLTRLPQCPDIFPRLEEMCDVHFKIPEYAEYRTAIGAALCYIRNREYKDIFCGKC